MNRIVEILFEAYVTSTPTGEIADNLRKISMELERQMDAGDVDADTVGEYEYVRFPK